MHRITTLVAFLLFLFGSFHGAGEENESPPQEDSQSKTMPVDEPESTDDLDSERFTTILDSPIGTAVAQGTLHDGRCTLTETAHTWSGTVPRGEAILGEFDFDKDCVFRLVDKYVGSDRTVIVDLGPDAVRGGDEPTLNQKILSGNGAEAMCTTSWTLGQTRSGWSDSDWITATEAYIEYCWPEGTNAWLTAANFSCNHKFEYGWWTVDCYESDRNQFGPNVWLTAKGEFTDGWNDHTLTTTSYGKWDGSGFCGHLVSGTYDGSIWQACTGSWD